MSIEFSFRLMELLYLHEIYSMNTFFSHMSGYLLGNNPQKVDKIRKFKLNLNFFKLYIEIFEFTCVNRIMN